MSNSGGSWGADGFLYLTGRDPANLRARLPKAGSVLELVNTIPMNIGGRALRGIARGPARSTESFARQRWKGSRAVVTG